MPARVFRFGTSGSLWGAAPSPLPEVSCAADADCCRPLSSVAIDCNRIKTSCSDAKCGMTVVLERAQPIWIVREVPDLGLLDGGAVSRLHITRVVVRGAEPRS